MSHLKVGLQLYSVRDKMEANMEETLKAVKEIGYDYVEFAGYFGKSAEEIAGLLKKYGLECISVHQALDFYQEKGVDAVNYVKALGATYSAIPWYQKEEYKKDLAGTLALFKEMGKLLADNGLKMLYHNHDFEYDVIDGKCIIDHIYESISPDLINPEFDTCWVKYAGHDPVAYLEKYADRIKVVHLKDFWCKKLGNGPVYALIDKDGNEIKVESREERGFEFRTIGSGLNDIPAILKTSEKIGAEYVIVEQDNWYDADSLDCAKKSREYLKSLGY